MSLNQPFVFRMVCNSEADAIKVQDDLVNFGIFGDYVKCDNSHDKWKLIFTNVDLNHVKSTLNRLRPAPRNVEYFDPLKPWSISGSDAFQQFK